MKHCGTIANMEGFFRMPVAEVSRVPPDILDNVWPHAAPLIESAFRQDTVETLDEIKSRIRDCTYQLWVALVPEIICAAVTMLIDRKREVVLHVEYGGAFAHTIGLWKDPLVAALTEFAKRHKASALECAGRIGWGRVFPEAKVVSVKMRKEI
jgi:hypothetical protein